MKIAVMGSGGVGGYFGARLAAAGNDVTFVARGSHLAAMRKDGLRLDSEIGNLHLASVQAVADAGEIAAADAIIFAVKMGDTESAAQSLRALVAKGATVFTFQNGVECAERIGKVVGAESVVPGVARIGSHISEPGMIKQTGTFASLEFGERDGKPSARTTAFHEACKEGGLRRHALPRHSSRDLDEVRHAGPAGRHDGPDARADRARARQRAVARAAAGGGGGGGGGRGGAEDRPGAGGRGQDHAAARRPSQADLMASMAHDLVAGKPIELDGLSGAVVRLGSQAGVATPSHKFITQALAPFAAGKPQV